MGLKTTEYAVRYPKLLLVFSTLMTLLILLLAILPSINAEFIPALKPLTINTDPENMLPYHEAARVAHRSMKKEFLLHDMVIVGVVNEQHPQGVFNPETLKKVHRLSLFSMELDGVIQADVLSPGTVDDIQQEGLGAIRFDWLMAQPPETEEKASQIKARALRIPLLKNTLVSANGKALAIYLPITSKDKSYHVYSELQKEIALLGEEQGDHFYIAGLPVAEEVFGVEMFIQMAVVAPLAMLVIFILLYFFFRNLTLVISPLLVALIAVIWTIGLLIIFGNSVHIMSSMIPIFIMPIAVLDAIHILSEFFDRYQPGQDRRKLIIDVVDTLFTPMLFTTLTTMAGFASLTLAPIPPIQTFGLFVAIGVFFAWLLTIVFIPAYIVLMSEASFRNFGLKKNATRFNAISSRFLLYLGQLSHQKYRIIIVACIVLGIFSGFGLKKITINDNPVKWFNKDHQIRIADQKLNQHMGGTYTAYLSLSTESADSFKEPEVLRYLDDLQGYLNSLALVGKTSSIVDITKTIHRDLFLENEEKFTVPDSPAAVAQVLLVFQSSHRSQDLWHFVNSDYGKANIWIQMKSGDNTDMEALVFAAESWLKQHPSPVTLEHEWFGLTYINMIWQNKMVAGMLNALLGSFVVVFFLMVILFRSFFWGLLAIIPLGVTMFIVYGMIGWLGKDYDMPVAVLSALSLGLSVDYAVHFIARSRVLLSKSGLSKNKQLWQAVWPQMFAEPVRAIFRNVVVVGLGFLPLLLSPLVPYNTVGILIASILLLAGLSSIIILPAMIRLFERSDFFAKTLAKKVL